MIEINYFRTQISNQNFTFFLKINKFGFGFLLAFANEKFLFVLKIFIKIILNLMMLSQLLQKNIKF